MAFHFPQISLTTLLAMHSGKRDLPYTFSHFPAKPPEFLRSSSWDAPSSGEKAANKRTRATLSHPVAEEGWASRHSWLRQNHFYLPKADLDVMLPYGFAAMMGLSQTLPDECCRLWLTESIFCSHNQIFPVIPPSRDRLKAWVGHSCTDSTLFFFFMSPGNFSSNNALKLTLLLQWTMKLHFLEICKIYRRLSKWAH